MSLISRAFLVRHWLPIIPSSSPLKTEKKKTTALATNRPHLSPHSHRLLHPATHLDAPQPTAPSLHPHLNLLLALAPATPSNPPHHAPTSPSALHPPPPSRPTHASPAAKRYLRRASLPHRFENNTTIQLPMKIDNSHIHTSTLQHLANRIPSSQRIHSSGAYQRRRHLSRVFGGDGARGCESRRGRTRRMYVSCCGAKGAVGKGLV